MRPYGSTDLEFAVPADFLAAPVEKNWEDEDFIPTDEEKEAMDEELEDFDFNFS